MALRYILFPSYFFGKNFFHIHPKVLILLHYLQI
ncbi:hypothetical protein SRH_00235 [Mesomycoplasma hyorhinis MCLD]|uniref:Uncharacterized protein n=1 Tax=Mesomycoplasma hyorhinis (strain MCLD) TaxID=936139 RepID=A0ABM5M5H8_MESHM|nr:hypothetical protein SRH_00235 [Mesomycoplasma hyorhinis MCLD]